MTTFTDFLMKIDGFKIEENHLVEVDFGFKSNLLEENEYYVYVSDYSNEFGVIFLENGFYYDSFISLDSDYEELDIRDFYFFKINNWNSTDFPNYPEANEKAAYKRQMDIMSDFIEQFNNYPEFRLKLLYKVPIENILNDFLSKK